MRSRQRFIIHESQARSHWRIIGGGVLTAVLVFVGLYGVLWHDHPSAATPPPSGQSVVVTAPPKQFPFSSPLDGVGLEQDPGKRIAVIVDFMVDARPPAGLRDASVVIQAPAEAGIPRLLAVFDQSRMPDRVGPVRSVRPYFVDWAQEYRSALAHVGGSPDGLARAQSSALRTINEFFEGLSFWRDSQRPAPHNVYTSKERMDLALSRNGRGSVPLFDDTLRWRWLTSDQISNASTSLLAHTITIPGLEAQYDDYWTYHSDTRLFNLADAHHALTDDRGTPLSAQNLIVQFASVRVLDTIGRRAIDTKGSGRALIARNGEVIDGTWKFDADEGRTRFYTPDGQEVLFVPGRIWIQVVPKGTAVEVK